MQWKKIITKTRLFKYTEHFTNKKWKFSDNNSDIFHISAQNIDCEYSLELPQWGISYEYPQSMFLSRNKKNQDKIFRRKRLSTGTNFVYVYLEIWDMGILKFNKFSM